MAVAKGAMVVRSRQAGNVRGGRAVFANIDQTSSGSSFSLPDCVSNDNELGADPPALAELMYLRRGLTQPGGKLPLFDLDGQQIDATLVRRCLERGWAEPWFNNPLKPDWQVCKLTEQGRRVAHGPCDA
jgi:hypothetical protein